MNTGKLIILNNTAHIETISLAIKSNDEKSLGKAALETDCDFFTNTELLFYENIFST